MPATAVSANVNSTDIFLSNSTHLAFGVDGSGNANSHIVFDGTNLVIDADSDAGSGGGVVLSTAAGNMSLGSGGDLVIPGGYVRTASGSFSVAASGTTTELITGLDSDTHYIVSLSLLGTNMAVGIIGAVITAGPNISSAVATIVSGDFQAGSAALQTRANIGNFITDTGNGNSFQFVCTGDTVAPRTANYHLFRLL